MARKTKQSPILSRSGRDCGITKAHDWPDIVGDDGDGGGGDNDDGGGDNDDDGGDDNVWW